MKTPAQVLRCFETMLGDGLGWADLDEKARRSLEGRAPPPAGDMMTSRGGAATSDAVAVAARKAAAPPELWVRPRGAAREIACGGNPAAAAAALVQARRDRAPVVMRGVGAAWPATRWTAATLARAFPAGAVCRVADTPGVSFCRESHPGR